MVNEEFIIWEKHSIIFVGHSGVIPGGGGGGGYSLMSYIGMCSPKGYGFSAVLAILVLDRVWLLYSSLDVGMFLSQESTFSSLLKQKSIKALHKLSLR